MRKPWIAVAIAVLVLAVPIAYTQTGAKAQRPSANGSVGAAAQRELAAVPAAAAATARACLQLYNGNTVSWTIDAVINPNTYPYPITGGTIKGTICGSPNVKITGGSLGSALSVNANMPAGCATPVKIIGNANVPVGYQGSYGFSGSNNMFQHHTLFLGYNKATCP